jgi:SOS-response transcriptional repressor LexA
MLRVIHDNGAPMTVRDLCKAMGYKSTSSAWEQAEQLKEQGFLRHVAGYEISEEGRKAVEGER